MVLVINLFLDKIKMVAQMYQKEVHIIGNIPLRNLGGAVGLAVINTLLSDRSALHCQRLSDAINWTNTIALEQLNAMAANLAARGVDGETGALAQMAARLHGQAAVMSFIDIFTLITALFGGLALAALLMRPAASGGGGSGH